MISHHVGADPIVRWNKKLYYNAANSVGVKIGLFFSLPHCRSQRCPFKADKEAPGSNFFEIHSNHDLFNIRYPAVVSFLLFCASIVVPDTSTMEVSREREAYVDRYLVKGELPVFFHDCQTAYFVAEQWCAIFTAYPWKPSPPGVQQRTLA